MGNISFYKRYTHEAEINQGDIFELNSNELKKYLKIISDKPLKFIVLSNSCDIYQENKNKITNICISEIRNVKDLIIGKNSEEKQRLAQNLSKYNDKVYFFLPNKKKIIGSSIAKLDANNSYLFKKLKEIILKKRLIGLNPPYREKLGWAVGNLFNRIALEHNEKKFENEISQL